VRKRGRKPFTGTEAELISQRTVTLQRYLELLAERVRRLQPDDSREDPEGREKVWAELTAIWPKAPAPWTGAESNLMKNLAALRAQLTAVLPKANAVRAISLASFIALIAVFSATTPAS
jgi:hypothetical protein